MKKLFMLITAIAVMFGGLAFMAPAANAGGGTETGSEITSESSSSSSDAAKVTSSAHAGGEITAKTVAYVKAKGTPKAKQTNCQTLTAAASYWTSYVNVSGQEVWHWKAYPKGKRFCLVNGQWRDPECHNKVKIGQPKSKKPRGIIIKGKIHIIVSFKFVAEAEAKVTATAKATAKAWCKNEWTYAEAYASANAYSYAYARARATAKTKAGAEAAASGAATQLSMSVQLKSDVEVDAKAKAKAAATADAYAKVTCGEGPPPPPPSAPILLDVTQINDLEVNATMSICASYQVAAGRSATLSFAPVFGTIVGTATFTVTGQNSKCVTLKAPSEVPQGHAGEGLPAGKDKVKYELIDTQSGQSDQAESVYTVHPKSDHPL